MERLANVLYMFIKKIYLLFKIILYKITIVKNQILINDIQIWSRNLAYIES